MRDLAMVSAAAVLALASGGGANAAIRCVSPDVASCFDTIQEAVDEAAPGDTISIRGKRNRTAYNEAVTIATENLTSVGQGASPTFRSVADLPEFGNLRPIDLDDPDVELWLDNYPAADEFRATLAALEAFLAEDALIDRCPPVVVEVCATGATGPGICGNDLEAVLGEPGVDVFTVLADGTTFANLTLRHGAAGIRLADGITGTTVEQVCFRNNNAAVQGVVVEDPDTGELTFPDNSGTAIRQSFVDGAGLFESFDIFGDDVVIERNLLLNAIGIEATGDGYVVSFNAVAGTDSDGCIEVEGPNGLVSYNIGTECTQAGLELNDGVDTTAIGNLFDGLPDEAEGIDADDPPEGSDDPADPGNLRTVIKHNFVRLTSGDGILLGADEALVEGNVVDRTGNDPGEAGLRIRGLDNQALYNLIRSSAYAAIHLEGPVFVEATDEEVPSSGSVIRGNLLTRNHTSGILLDTGFFDFDLGVGVPAVADTTIDANRITFNDGEGAWPSRLTPSTPRMRPRRATPR
jgi:hypothetical protein